eukprot:TRINITY_DN2821_c0_g2_i1.p1 TRINITY_DN2821_c0_g2~~TRINITY_DN2821_c0_g2_i1.p1  ORF type:complete len:161 (-),score=6.32 TRINITY_DN2821_c0_g2_i1:134-547(-)
MSRVFRRHVEVGRVCLINYGPDKGKLCVIVDVIDTNEALVDGPSGITGVRRHAINFKRLSLTDIAISIPRSCRHKTLSRAFLEADVIGKWKKSRWARKRMMKQRRRSLSDFDRFQVMVAKKKKNRVIRRERRRLERL